MELNEFLHLLLGLIQSSQRESQPQLGCLSELAKSCPHCSILGGKSRASLSCCIQIPQEFIHGSLHVGLPGPQGCTQVISSNDLEPEELHHERLRQDLVDLPDKAHLLHRLKVEVVHLIHDLSHLPVNFSPFEHGCGRRLWPGCEGKLQGRGGTLPLQTAFCCKLLFAGFLVPSCPKRALVWGTVVRGLRVEIFVRVLRSSRVNLNNVK